MVGIRQVGLVALLLAVGALETQGQVRGAATLPTEQYLNRAGLTRAWWGHAVNNSARDRVLYVTLDRDNRLYVQSSNSVLTAFDAESGRKLWATRLGSYDEVVQRCSYSKDYVFAVHGTTCYAVRKVEGDVAWELNLPGSPSTPPATDGKLLYVGMNDGSMYAFDYQRIAELSQRGLMPRWSFTTMVWRYKTSAPIVSAALPSGRLVTFASQSGSLYSVTAEDRRLVYQFETDARLSAPVVRYGDWLILAGEDFNVYALHVDNGRVGWQFPAGTDVKRAPVVVRDEIFLMPERGGLYNLAAATGTKKWWNPRAREFLAASPDRVYALGSGNLMALSAADGTNLASLPMPAFPVHVQNSLNDRLYLCSTSGLLICLREIDLDFPAAHTDFDDKPIVPVIGPDAPEATAEPAAENPAQ